MSAWTYSQKSGWMKRPDGVVIGTGYSGAQPYVNRPLAEGRENEGPIPTGNYKMLTAYDHDNLGPCSIPLEPAPDNEMHGRDDFFIHGDTASMDQTASQGCIIMTRAVRDEINTSDVKELVVVV